MRIGGVVVVVLLFVTMFTTFAHADPPVRLVVREFEGGDNAKPLRDAVVRLLTDADHVVIAVKPGADTAAIAKDLGAAATVSGVLARSRARTFTLQVSLDDEVVSTFKLGRKPTLARRQLVVLKKALGERIARLPPVAKPEPEPEPEPARVVEEEPKQQETPPPSPPIAVVAPRAAPPTPPRAKWVNFAPFRHGLPRNLITLRSYYDSRDFGAVEKVIGFRAPLGFTFYTRTTLRSGLDDKSDLDTFSFEGLIGSPMVYGLGLAAFVGSASGTDNDAVRAGFGHSFVVAPGPLRAFVFVSVMPYDSNAPGGRALTLITMSAWRFRSETVAAYVWSAIGEIANPTQVFVRPDLRLQVYKSFGVYTQYEFNSAAMTNRAGLRFGAEIQSFF